ncbi:hypothetical protein GBA65_01335 [Rubrobacter marinus]|uniref:Response regulatory domain-containing protein n=1 Tax=Rubrobacter marinus TaxID=2653852 RepID=A0A6G8PUG4_9ACTN|nr:hypothetical protein [Rubrobacter marinus]QIN77375.1 hypothetical protein GBA65_01335 [Rubrobacter marinus]
MRKTRVLLANAPRSYREVIASAVHDLRPNLDVFVAEPGEIEGKMESLAPDVVICSEVYPAVERGARAWIQLYPEGEQTAVVSVEGERVTLPNLEFFGLLSAVDRADAALRQGTGAPRRD